MRDIVLAKTHADAKKFRQSDLGRKLNDPLIVTPSSSFNLWSIPLGRLYMTNSASEHPRFVPWMRTILYLQGKMLAKSEA